MKAFAEACMSCEISPEELSLWVERRWVLPVAGGRGDWLFDESDIARLRMIRELTHDLAIDEEAMPVVLGLLDQVYGLRRRLRALLEAMAELPEPQREAIARRLSGEGAGERS